MMINESYVVLYLIEIEGALRWKCLFGVMITIEFLKDDDLGIVAFVHEE
jgi:hypothetical protein